LTEERTEDKGSKTAALTLMIFIPVIGTGGTAIVSYFRFFSIQEVILNTIIAAALCIVAEMPLKRLTIDSKGVVYFVYSYLSGLLLAVLSGFCFEFILPLAAPAVLIGILGGTPAGSSALLLFTGISTLVLYESGLYFFLMFFVGYILLMFFTLHREVSVPSAVFTSLSAGGLTFYACSILSKARLAPENVVFPLVGLLLDFIIILIMRPKIYLNVIDAKENFINSILDPEYELLQKLKNDERREYDKVIHSIHIANILMERMGLERIKLLGTGYYCRIGVLRGENSNVAEKSLSLIHERDFPKVITDGILEYYGLSGTRLSRESGALIVINSLIDMIYDFKHRHKGEKADYSIMINSVMKRITAEKSILQSDLSLNDLNVISETLRKQAFYYDFIL